MGGFGLGLVGLALIWFGLQLTISPALKTEIAGVGASVAALPVGSDGAIGPIVVSGNVCSLLTAPDGVKRSFSRMAYFSASRSATALRARYRFEPVGGCQRGAENAVLAYDREK